jgi:type 1 fimbria pilin
VFPGICRQLVQQHDNSVAGARSKSLNLLRNIVMTPFTKIVLIPSALLAMLAGQAAFAANATGTITLSGKVTESSCSLSDATVSLGNYSTAFFSAKGSKSRDARVAMVLSCSGSENGKLRFVGELDASDSSLFKNTSADNGIALELSKADGSKIDASKMAEGQYAYSTIAGVPLNIDLLAHMVSTSNTVGGGEVHSVITVEVAPD